MGGLPRCQSENIMLPNPPPKAPRSPLMSGHPSDSSTKSEKGAVTSGQGHGCQLHGLGFTPGRARDPSEMRSFGVCFSPWPDPPSWAPGHILSFCSQSHSVLWVPGYQGGGSHHLLGGRAAFPCLFPSSGGSVVKMNKGDFPHEGHFHF